MEGCAEGESSAEGTAVSPPASARPADNQGDHHGWREGGSEYWEWVASEQASRPA